MKWYDPTDHLLDAANHAAKIIFYAVTCQAVSSLYFGAVPALTYEALRMYGIAVLFLIVYPFTQFVFLTTAAYIDNQNRQEPATP